MKEKVNNFAKFRKEAGFTQKSLAEALNVTDKAVSKWERGLSMPDVSLLPRLSLILGIDLSLLLSPSRKHPNEGWIGLIDLRNSNVDLRQIVYDKPLVYFMLSHFMLADVRNICVLTTQENCEYLQSPLFSELGFHFFFDLADCVDHDLMILNRPIFLFGSDLTRQFQGAMVSCSLIQLVPENIFTPFLFCPAEYFPVYLENPDSLYEIATSRTLGRGMVCMDMGNLDLCMEVAVFVRMYQKNSGLLIGCLEEIAYRKGLIDQETLYKIAKNAPYWGKLRKPEEMEIK